MANFLEDLFKQLESAEGRTVLREIRGEQFAGGTGRELLEQIARARNYLRELDLQPGDRCAILGNNSIQWVALDLALMAEGAIVVPLYARQAATEIVGMMKDCSPRFFFVSDAELGGKCRKGLAGRAARHFVRRSAEQNSVGRGHRRCAESAQGR